MSGVAQDGMLSLTFAFDELPTLVGRDFRSDWLAVDADRLPMFDDATYVSLNPHALSDDLYPEALVEGFHLIALLDHLSNPLFRLAEGTLSGWNYGFDNVRFVSPVQAGQPLRLVGRLGSVVPRGEGYKVRLDCHLEVEGRDRPALVAEWWVLWFLAPPVESSHS